jgi:carbon storage regulator
VKDQDKLADLTTQTHLVLTRRRDESFMIGDGIVVTILQVDGGKVRIGILAPKNVVILREELYTPPTEAKQ